MIATLTRQEALEAIAKHKQMGRDMAYSPERHLLLLDVELADCVGFVEVSIVDMHVNGLLFELRPNGRYMPLAFGCLASRVDWHQFHHSILEMHRVHMTEAADEE